MLGLLLNVLGVQPVMDMAWQYGEPSKAKAETETPRQNLGKGTSGRRLH